ncbi:hypothetical protein B0H17DRAFT_1335682 [Mycena rosella]|uniref:Uncharacterized protein n=1 Tax=Mycena rosella TaxID=1033263 RepID=A0AAD7CYS4_MYCRO|nr:hypothetical protein B0H17DRAFT_1335682 [Mycena rosella]
MANSGDPRLELSATYKKRGPALDMNHVCATHTLRHLLDRIVDALHPRSFHGPSISTPSTPQSNVTSSTPPSPCIPTPRNQSLDTLECSDAPGRAGDHLSLAHHALHLGWFHTAVSDTLRDSSSPFALDFMHLSVFDDDARFRTSRPRRSPPSFNNSRPIPSSSPFDSLSRHCIPSPDTQRLLSFCSANET